MYAENKTIGIVIYELYATNALVTKSDLSCVYPLKHVRMQFANPMDPFW